MKKSAEELKGFLKPRKLFLILWQIFLLITLLPVIVLDFGGGLFNLSVDCSVWTIPAGLAAPVFIIIFTLLALVALAVFEFVKLPENLEKILIPAVAGGFAVLDLIFWIVLAASAGCPITFWYILGYIILALIIALAVFCFIGLAKVDEDLITTFSGKAATAKAAKVVICPNCGGQIPKGSAFCPKCGTPAPQPPKCPNCGKEVDENTAFCPSCGTKIKE